MIVQTGRFGKLTVGDDEIIQMPNGILGFPDLTEFCLVDPGDETLILWLQSTQDPKMAFPVLEPKIFKPDYTARLSASELRELKLENLSRAAVFCVLTIPGEISMMTANLKAPLVVNLQAQVARQVVLQENEYGLKHPMFKELRQHIVTLQNQRLQREVISDPEEAPVSSAVSIKHLLPSQSVKTLNA